MHSHANPLCVNENLLHHTHLLLSKWTQELCWSASNDIVWSAFQLTDWFEYLEEAPRHCIWYTWKSRTWAEGKPHGAYSQQHKGLLFQNNMAMSSAESVHTRQAKVRASSHKNSTSVHTSTLQGHLRPFTSQKSLIQYGYHKTWNRVTRQIPLTIPLRRSRDQGGKQPCPASHF